MLNICDSHKTSGYHLYMTARFFLVSVENSFPSLIRACKESCVMRTSKTKYFNATFFPVMLIYSLSLQDA